MVTIETIIDRLSEGVELLQKSLQCSICLEVLNNPVRTRCCHTFCQDCIMTVVNNNRIAHCPLCNKTINRRSILENEQVALLVKKVQTVIEGIGKDTGFDITEHVKLPSSTREAYVASPKYLKKTSVQPVNSLEQFSKPQYPTSKEQWLKRYEKQYPVRHSDGDADLLSISQAESVIPSYIPHDKVLQPAKCKVEKVKVPPLEKVQEWLQKNDEEFGQANESVMSSLISPQDSQQQTHIVTVTADVHRTIDDDRDLLSVSQLHHYMVPRKGNTETLKCSSEELTTSNSIQISSDQKPFTTKHVDKNKIDVEKVTVDFPNTNAEQDPYEFISSQKTYETTKKRRKSKNKRNKTSLGSVRTYQPSLKRNSIIKKDVIKTSNLNKIEHPVQSQTESFIYPIDVNDTFDNLVLNTHKYEHNNNNKEQKEQSKPGKQISEKIDNIEEENEDMLLFKTPLDSHLIYQKHDETSTESMSDVDFSSGSDEDWGKTNKVDPEALVVSGKRTRRSSNKEPSKKLDREGSIKRRTRLSSCLQKQEEETDYNKYEAVKDLFEKPGKPLITTEKNTPLSPSKELNSKDGIFKQDIKISKQHIRKLEHTSALGKELSHTDKENLVESVETHGGLQNISTINTTITSRSPGWSRISQTKKDFEKFKKPTISALNVSGGKVCVTKKHAANEETKVKVMSPMPAIEDVESNVSISSAPVVAFNSPDAIKRAQFMSKIVRDLENQVEPLTASKSDYVNADAKLSEESKLGQEIVKIDTNVSFNSAFSQPGGLEESPASIKRKQQINMIVSTLNEEDNSCESALVMNTRTKVDEGEKRKDNSCTQTILDVLNSPKKDVRVVPESSSIVSHEEIEFLQIPKKNLSENQVTVGLGENSCPQNGSTEPRESFTNLVQTVAGCDFDSSATVGLGENSGPQTGSTEPRESFTNLVQTVAGCDFDSSATVLSESDANLQELNNRNHRFDCSASCPKVSANCKNNPSTYVNVSSEVIPPLHEQVEEKVVIEKPTCKKDTISVSTYSSCTNIFRNRNESQTVNTPRKDNNTLHIPFFKCGVLKRKTKHSKVKFLRLGTLVPHVESLQESSSATLQVTIGSCNTAEVGIQTSPLRSNLVKPDAKVMTTPSTNPNLVQFTTPLWNSDSQVQSENFVPDSYDDLCIYESSIPLPHHHTALWTTPSNPNRHEVKSPICEVAGTSCNNRKVTNGAEKDNCVTRESDLHENTVLEDHNTCSKPLDKEMDDIPISQFSTATTVKFKKCISSDGELKHPESVPESFSNLAESSLSISLLQNSNSQSNNNADTESKISWEKCEKGDLDNEKCEKKEEIINLDNSGLTVVNKNEDIELHENSNSKSDIIKNSRRSSKASRQLKFSPHATPKLSDPALDDDKMERVKSEKLQKKVNRMVQLDVSSTPGTPSSAKSLESYIINSETVLSADDDNDRGKKRKSYKRIRKLSDSSDSEFPDDKKKQLDLKFELTEKAQNVPNETAKSEKQNVKQYISAEDEEIVDLLTPPEERLLSGSCEKKFEEWLNESVPDTEELMERMMANINADLAETRKRKLMENSSKTENNVKRESPTLFTPPPIEQPRSESEDANQITCELVVTQPEIQAKQKLLKETSIGGTESESICTQQVQARIDTLEAEIKQCQAALDKVETKQLNIPDSKVVSIESGSESDDEIIEPTPVKEISADITRDSRSGRKRSDENKKVTDVEGDHMVQLKQNLDKNKSIAPRPVECQVVTNSTETNTGENRTLKSPGILAHNNMESHSTLSVTPKQFVLRLPSTSNLSEVAGERKMCKPGTVGTPVELVKSPVTQGKSAQLCFVCSGLPMGLIARVKTLAGMVGAEFSNKFEPHTTHLVVKASDDMMADKTYKYLSAVVRRKWIVSISWVNACLQAKKLLPEDEYEMLDSSGENGPHRSRTSSDPLFRNFEFCCIEPFTDLTKVQLEDMLKECGAAIVSGPERFTFRPGYHSMILVQMDAEREEECKAWWEKFGVLPVGHEWVFECIGRYRIVPLWSYLVCHINEDHIRALGYPEDALASDEEADVDSEVG